jgi:hypothetical protein
MTRIYVVITYTCDVLGILIDTSCELVCAPDCHGARTRGKNDGYRGLRLGQSAVMFGSLARLRFKLPRALATTSKHHAVGSRAFLLKRVGGPLDFLHSSEGQPVHQPAGELA